ncbi:MAG: transposase [Acidobacteria bacterium]|nr:MAG: transposase [Acidobacteriota bacterium]
MTMPEHYSPVMPYIIASDAEGLIGFITEVFDAKEKLRVNREDGSPMHCEYSINGGTIMFGQASEDWKAFPCGMFVLVMDVDEIHKKAIANDATSILEPGDRGYGLASGFADPWGNQWWLNNPEAGE